MADVIEKINDLFSGDHPDSSVRSVVTHVKDRLEDSETLQQQAQNNTWPGLGHPDLHRVRRRSDRRYGLFSDLSTQILNSPDLS